ncbi:MAG TPA: hypothetical protein ENN07_06730 [candidate division Zixibacteria bacterium]|nr:hypothetical protein [candidate division Zixibacteria bacterium]
MPQPKKSLRFSHIALAILSLCSIAVAQTEIIFDVISAGGNEHFGVTSSRYKLTSTIGQSTPISAEPLTGTSHSIFPGYRKIDRDYWYPFSWFTITVHYASATSFELTWSGMDTTSHDGEGWGIWNYDLQYRTEGGAWTDWHMATVETSATFGPSAPVVVEEGESYYFRLRARDKVRNVAPWTEESGHDTTVITVNYTVEFCIHTPAPGLSTDAFNFATIEYFPVAGLPTSVNLWEGECVELSCVPGERASISRTTSDSDGEERWAVSNIDDTAFVITGSTDYDIPFWHQIRPTVHLVGTDITHTVSTLQREEFGSPHLESGLWELWTDWLDYGSTLEFSEWTTGSPARRAEADDSVRFRDITSSFTDTINYTAAGNMVTIQTNFGDSVYVDGTRFPSPHHTNWFIGSSHEIAVCRTVHISDCERWVFQQWHDGSIDTSRMVTIDSDTVFTAIFERQLRVEITNPSGIGYPIPAVGSYWFAEGDTVEGHMDVTGVVDYMLVGWLGTGSALSGGGASFWFIIHDCSSIEWRWVPASDDLCTLRVYSRYGHPHPSGVYVVPRGTLVWASVEDSTFEGGDWHHCTGWLGDGDVVPAEGDSNILSFTMTDNGWLVWQWDGNLELPLVVSSSPSIHGPPVPPVGTHWYEIDSPISAFVEENPDEDWFCTGYIASGALPTTSADSVHFILSAPTEIDWQWVYYPSGPLDTVWIFSRFGDPLPTRGMHRYPRGTVVTAVVTPFDGPNYCSGWSGTGSVPGLGTGTSVSFTLDAFSTLTWNWNDELLVPLVVINPGGYGNPTPNEGVHWYEMFTEVSASVTSPYSGWFCVGYNGFGSVPGFGYPPYCHFTIAVASGIEWLWADEAYILRVTAPAYSDPVPPAGITYHPPGRHIVATNVDTLWEHDAFRYVCKGWTGDGTVVPIAGTTSMADFTMTANATLEWLYQTQFYLELDYYGLPEGIEPDVLDFEGWFARNDTVVLVTDSVVMDGDDPYVFLRWDDSGIGAPIDNIFSDSTFIVIDSSYTILAEFREAVWVEIIKSPPGNDLGWIRINTDTTYGEAFAGYLVRDFEYTVQVSPYDANSDVMFNFLHWRVDSLAASQRTFTPLSDTVLYADYQRFWHIIIEKHPPDNHLGKLEVDEITYAGAASVRQSFWWEDGSIHRFNVTARDSTPTIRYDFNRWNDGSTSVSRIYGPVTGPDSLAALYNKTVLCRVEKVPSQPYGAIEITGTRYYGVGAVDFWHPWGDAVVLAVSKYDAHDDSVYIFSHWDIPGEPTDSAWTWLDVREPQTFRAIYNGSKINIYFEIGQHGVMPRDSIYWLIPDSLDFGEERVMPIQDSIRIVSLSNVPIDFSLGIDRIKDLNTGTLDPHWTPAYFAGVGRFALHAQFTDLSTPPVTWARIHDYVKDTPFWASSIIFGPGGHYIQPEGYPNSSTMLWFKFTAPLASENSTHQRAICLKLSARMYLP